jgi:CheY-like chemotaxis protein
VGNAVKFTFRGHVAVSVVVDETPAAALHFAVADTGIGIAGKHKEVIFDDFVQGDGSTNRKYGGSGLGLAISRRLVQIMGGRIWLESEEGRGSTFHFCIPLQCPVRELPEPAETFPIGEVRKDVVVVSGNGLSAASLIRLLERFGCETRTVLETEVNSESFSLPFADLIVIDQPADRAAAAKMMAAIQKQMAGRETPVLVLHAPLRPSSWRSPRVFALAKPFKESKILQVLRHVLCDEAADALVPGRPALKVEEGVGLEVLLVEDNAVNQKVASRLLEKKGCSVRAAGNGREALARYAEQPFDLIFMDVQMPEMNGFEATRTIRHLEKTNGTRTPIIALTANAMATDRELCLEAGMDDYLAKPIEVEKLNDMIVKYGKLKSREVSKMETRGLLVS